MTTIELGPNTLRANLAMEFYKLYIRHEVGEPNPKRSYLGAD